MTDSLSTRTSWLALVILCVGDLMIVVDTTVVNVALPSIHTGLGFSQTSLAWVVNAYMLTFGGFLLLAGRFGDLFGHRRLFLGGTRVHHREPDLRRLDDAGDADRRAGGAGARGRGRLGRRVLGDRRALQRATPLTSWRLDQPDRGRYRRRSRPSPVSADRRGHRRVVRCDIHGQARPCGACIPTSPSTLPGRSSSSASATRRRTS